MNELTIKVELSATPELMTAISKLLGIPAPQTVQQATTPQQTMITTQQPQQTVPVQQTAPNVVPMHQPQQAAPMQQTVPVQSVAPTATPVAPQYTLDQLGKAGAELMKTRQQDVLNLLAQFGVQALTQLPREHYGAFATALRGLGANI